MELGREGHTEWGRVSLVSPFCSRTTINGINTATVGHTTLEVPCTVPPMPLAAFGWFWWWWFSKGGKRVSCGPGFGRDRSIFSGGLGVTLLSLSLSSFRGRACKSIPPLFSWVGLRVPNCQSGGGGGSDPEHITHPPARKATVPTILFSLFFLFQVCL